jgi:hypothetical protein
VFNSPQATKHGKEKQMSRNQERIASALLAIAMGLALAELLAQWAMA